eukprot:Clim_evm35s199 gene=Clim_evmTU35s199
MDVLETSEKKDLLKQLPEDSQNVWKYFLRCTEVPRPSGDLDRIRSALAKIAEGLGAQTKTDGAGNLYVIADGYKCSPDTPPLAIQCHLDMVTSKNDDTEFDFKTQPINCQLRTIKDEQWLAGNGTTLGADDGIGVAACLAILEDNSAPKPPLELVFTADEETDMSGAEFMDKEILKSRQMINVDSEEESSICIGCAGGFETDVTLPVERSELSNDSRVYGLRISGLAGGHTGIDIDKPKYNAIKVLSSVLQSFGDGLQLLSMKGGTAVNSIPREASALVAVSSAIGSGFTELVQQKADQIYSEKLESFEVECKVDSDAAKGGPDVKVVSVKDTQTILQLIKDLHHGPVKMSDEVEGMVESSASLSLVTLASEEDSFVARLFPRSSSDEGLNGMYADIKKAATQHGATASEMENYFPGWRPNTKTPLFNVAKEAQIEVFGNPGHIYSVHAGLECGFIQKNYPDMACVSIGPLIEMAHTPEERIMTSSVGRFYRVLRTIVSKLATK